MKHCLPPTQNDEAQSGRSSFWELAEVSNPPFVQASPG